MAGFFNKWRRYSYTAQKHQKSFLLKLLIWLSALFFLHLLVSSFLVSTVVIRTESMYPGLKSGDRLVVLSQNIRTLVPSFLRDESKRIQNLGRGDLVLVHAYSDNEKDSVLYVLMDRIVRFFTVQQLSLNRTREAQPYVKRLVGLPGDNIEMSDYVLRIQARDSEFSLTEFELSDKLYDVDLPGENPLWDQRLPFSGVMKTMELANDECFVISDDRSNTNDSRTWGAVPVDRIEGRVVFRYWPFSRFGRL